tara:strand:- start:22656 stop:24035 length:1380 start_codon:yes stop_codon:yes gene_type:complete
MLNPFFLQGSKTEQSLVQDLINEQLRMYGVEIYYVPRQYITQKTVIKEVIQSKFETAYPLEAYVNTYEGYEGQGTILSKFGVQPLNDLTLTISKERYEIYITPLIQNIPNIELPNRPKEGDLVYFPLGDRLFEIKFVEHEQPFYQLQKTYVYELKCELFRYEDEIVDTSIEELDDNIKDGGYIQTLNLIGTGVTASAITGIVNGGIRYVTLMNRGGGYNSPPRVSISSAPSGGITAVGIATMIGGLIDCNGTSSLKVQGVEIINSGYGYTVAPSVLFFEGGGSGAAATATIGNGIIGIASITNGGSGYVSPPTITFSSPGFGGITATASAKINNVGTVTQISIINAGLGYTSAPTITLSSPYMIGVGTYIYNEYINGSISGTTAKVKNWDAITGELKVYEIDGNFVNGDVIVGAASSAFYKLRTVTEDNTSDLFADNITIEQEADKIIDFTEKNPFGIP